jgi:hypothetical protein
MITVVIAVAFVLPMLDLSFALSLAGRDSVIISVDLRRRTAVAIVCTAVICAVRADGLDSSVDIGATYATIAIRYDLPVRFVHASPTVGRLITVDDAAIVRPTPLGRRAIRLPRLLARRNSIDPNPAHSSGRPLPRRNAAIPSAATLCHHGHCKRQRGERDNEFDFFHRYSSELVEFYTIA